MGHTRRIESLEDPKRPVTHDWLSWLENSSSSSQKNLLEPAKYDPNTM
jgi:hypothetical protein